MAAGSAVEVTAAEVTAVEVGSAVGVIAAAVADPTDQRVCRP